MTGSGDETHRSSHARIVLLGVILGLHLVSRYDAHQTLPLSVRHFYPSSYFISLALMNGAGFKYLLPADTKPPRDGWAHTVGPTVPPPAGTAAAAVAGFLELRGPTRVSRSQLQDYFATAVPLATGPWEVTRVFDVYFTAALWKVFGASWDAYFAFYSLLSTVASLMLFVIARRATGSYWCGIAASVGFLVSPLERHASIWSGRDTAPLWFTALAFGALAWCWNPARRGGPFLAGVVAGVASLIGLGWRPDVQTLPLLVLCSLGLLSAAQDRPRRDFGLAAAGIGLGCGLVLVALTLLGPASATDQGATVFHAAWYGEASRSNVLRTQNSFQVARDDMLSVYQANYFARQRAGSEARMVLEPNDRAHLTRARAMYGELAQVNALTWWRSFPSFLAAGLQVDQQAVLGSETEADFFYSGNADHWTSLLKRSTWYGRLLPWLAGLGALGGLLHVRARAWTTILLSLLAYHALVVMLVLPEPKHFATLLLPLHVLAAIGLWSAARLLTGRASAPDARPLRPLVAGFSLAAALWLGLGAIAATISSRSQRDIVRGILERAPGQEAEGWQPGAKIFSVEVGAENSAAPHGYLLTVRSSKWVDLLCVHRRVRENGEGFLAYYTRHVVAPGRDRQFFFNIVAGADLGDDRAYTAWVRLVGAAEIVSVRRLDLAGWSLGLPLGLTLDGTGESIEPTFIGAQGPATQSLDSPAMLAALLDAPRNFLVARPPR